MPGVHKVQRIATAMAFIACDEIAIREVKNGVADIMNVVI